MHSLGLHDEYQELCVVKPLVPIKLPENYQRNLLARFDYEEEKFFEKRRRPNSNWNDCFAIQNLMSLDPVPLRSHNATTNSPKELFTRADEALYVDNRFLSSLVEDDMRVFSQKKHIINSLIRPQRTCFLKFDASYFVLTIGGPLNNILYFSEIVPALNSNPSPDSLLEPNLTSPAHVVLSLIDTIYGVYYISINDSELYLVAHSLCVLYLFRICISTSPVSGPSMQLIDDLSAPLRGFDEYFSSDAANGTFRAIIQVSVDPYRKVITALTTDNHILFVNFEPTPPLLAIYDLRSFAMDPCNSDGDSNCFANFSYIQFFFISDIASASELLLCSSRKILKLVFADSSLMPMSHSQSSSFSTEEPLRTSSPAPFSPSHFPVVAQLLYTTKDERFDSVVLTPENDIIVLSPCRLFRFRLLNDGVPAIGGSIVPINVSQYKEICIVAPIVIISEWIASFNLRENRRVSLYHKNVGRTSIIFSYVHQSNELHAFFQGKQFPILVDSLTNYKSQFLLDYGYAFPSLESFELLSFSDTEFFLLSAYSHGSLFSLTCKLSSFQEAESSSMTVDHTESYKAKIEELENLLFSFENISDLYGNVSEFLQPLWYINGSTLPSNIAIPQGPLPKKVRKEVVIDGKALNVASMENSDRLEGSLAPAEVESNDVPPRLSVVAQRLKSARPFSEYYSLGDPLALEIGRLSQDSMSLLSQRTQVGHASSSSTVGKRKTFKNVGVSEEGPSAINDSSFNSATLPAIPQVRRSAAPGLSQTDPFSSSQVTSFGNSQPLRSTLAPSTKPGSQQNGSQVIAKKPRRKGF